ncbi:MAG: hypothetical protein ABF479_11300 [Gluconacetobacter sp.]
MAKRLYETEKPTYRSWTNMRQRCLNPNLAMYDRYGGRGIKVTDRWNDFSLFLEDMGRRPDNHSIDRIDVNGDYEPSNCRWADAKTQNNNSRNSIYIEYNDISMSLYDWSLKLGFDIYAAKDLYRKNRPIDEVFQLSISKHTKKIGSEKLYTYNEITMNISQWAKYRGISQQCLSKRLNSGKWTLGQALNYEERS